MPAKSVTHTSWQNRLKILITVLLVFCLLLTLQRSLVRRADKLLLLRCIIVGMYLASPVVWLIWFSFSRRRGWAIRGSGAVIAMLLFASGWWWITLPGRTLHEFQSLVVTGKFDLAKNCFANGYEPSDNELRYWQTIMIKSAATVEPRSWSDCVRAHQRLKMSGLVFKAEEEKLRIEW